MPENKQDEHQARLSVSGILLVAGLLMFVSVIVLTALLGNRNGGEVFYSGEQQVKGSSPAAFSEIVSECDGNQTEVSETPSAETKKSSSAAKAEPAAVTKSSETVTKTTSAEQTVPTVSEIVYPVDINLAGFEELTGVDGIGEVTANEIIGYRDMVGIIHRMEQLTEIDGIGEKTLELLCSYFYVSDADYIPPENEADSVASDEISAQTDSVIEEQPEPQLHDVNINTATAEEIAEGLLLTETQAAAIVELRENIQYFSAVEELLYTEVITAEDIERIRDYVII